MLVLTRKIEEAIMIGDDVEVRVLGRNAGQVRLGITAPREIPVRRKEQERRTRPVSKGDPVEP